LRLGSSAWLGTCTLALTLTVAGTLGPRRARADASAPEDAPSAAGSPPAEATPPRAEEPPVELPEVVVRVPAATPGATPSAAATTVPADRYAGEAKGVAELLAASPGVEVTRYGTRGQLATVQIRGVAAEGVKVLVDGLPLGSVGGGIDLETIPRAWIGRIDVVRGPSAAALGAGALGGAVNVVTRDADAGAASGEVTGGSFGTYSASAEGAARAGAFTAFVAATAENTRGNFPYVSYTTPDLPGAGEELTRENNAARRAGLLMKVGGLVGDLRLDALAQASAGRRELPGTPPWNLTPDDWSEDGRALAMVRLAGTPAPGIRISGRLYGRADVLDERLAGLGLVRQHGGAGGAALEARLAHPGGAATLGIEGGGEGYASDALGGTRTRTTIATSLTEAWRAIPGRLQLEPTVRTERTGPFGGVSAKLGAALELGGGLLLRASAGRTYRVPSFAELYLQQGLLIPNPGLRPETGTGVDAALAYDGALGVASVGGHATIYDDVITYEPATNGRFTPYNTGRALASGLEAEASTAPAPRLLGLSLQAAYTFLHTEFLRAPTGVLGNALPRRPRQRLQARASIAPGRFGAHVEARVVRDTWVNRMNTKPVPDETVFSAGAFVRVLRHPHLAVHVEVENLADVRTLQDGYGQPLPGRTVMVTLRVGTTPQPTQGER